MRAHEIFETPLPDTWDKSTFQPSVPFKTRMAYAIERAKKLGRGSSRTAFTIDYQGRPTALKVAHTKKGMAQNEAEADVLSDSRVQGLNITIPLIDHDSNYTWIHTEQAGKVSEKQLMNLMKTPSLDTLITHAMYQSIGNELFSIEQYVKSKVSDDDFKIFKSYSDKLLKLYEFSDVLLNDLVTPNNWGIYQGHPVVIDVGYTQHVLNHSYN